MAWQENLSAKLPQKTFSLAYWIFWFASWNKCVPFELVGKSDLHVKMFDSKWKLYCWYGANWIFTFAFAFQWTSFAYETVTKSFSQQLAVHLGYLVVISFAFVYMRAMYLKPEEATFMLNQQIFLLRSLEGLKLPAYKWWAEPFIVFSINYVIILCSIIWSILVSFYIIKPERSCYLYSYLPQSMKQSTIVYSTFLAYESLYTMWAVSILIAYYVFWSTDLFMLNHITKYLAKRKSVSQLDLRGYIYLQLFCRFFNNFTGTFFIVGFCIVVVACPVAFFFVSLTCFNQLGFKMQVLYPFAAVWCVILIVVIVPQDAKVSIDSTRYLVHLKKKRNEFSLGSRDEVRLFGLALADRRSHEEFICKRLQAFVPVRIEIWFFGHFTISTSQTMIEQLFNNLILLLSL